ncbi:MAG TPA: 3-phosphoshikimate 1-carboxyvinyltransferase [Casimicrobiaceae bacterium]|nr:3-phosphoshikimate 1-carboxyvinyltransferase [Casimicrobiaceae bacterium]
MSKASGRALQQYLDLQPVSRMTGSVRLPGSKSISNRILLLAALARGDTRIEGLLEADDVDRMLGALQALGIPLERVEEQRVTIVHGAAGAFPVKHAALSLGNAGTAFRPLTAVLAFSGGDYRLSGVPRMHARPIADLVDALRAMEADIRYTGREGYPPLAIGPGVMRTRSAPAAPVAIRGDVSSQFVSALLMALPLADVGVTLEVTGELISRPYVEITLDLMRRFGVDVERDASSRFLVPAHARYVSPGTIVVEGDASSASYFLAAGAVAGGPVRVIGVGMKSIQGDVRFADVLAAMGASVDSGEDWIEVRRVGPLKGIDADFNMIPDAAMTAAVVALFADGPTTLRNIASWRVKETDRIAAMAAELSKLGAIVEQGPDWLRVVPPSKLRTATIDTYDDHRMAMCFSLAALGGVAVRINDPQCVSKTFPDYFAEFAKLAA